MCFKSATACLRLPASENASRRKHTINFQYLNKGTISIACKNYNYYQRRLVAFYAVATSHSKHYTVPTGRSTHTSKHRDRSVGVGGGPITAVAAHVDLFVY